MVKSSTAQVSILLSRYFGRPKVVTVNTTHILQNI